MSKPVILCIASAHETRQQFQAHLQDAYGEDYHLAAVGDYDSALAQLKRLRAGGSEIIALLCEYQQPTAAIASQHCVNALKTLDQQFPAVVKILLVTPGADLHADPWLISHHSTRYLYHPWQPQDLRLTLKATIEHYHQRQQIHQQQQMLDALQLQNAQLLNTLQESKQTILKSQAQLLEQDKMAVLGQMVAGITHEINNPVSFIAGSLKYGREYLDDIISVLRLYQEHYPEPHAAIAEKIQEVDFNYLLDDFSNLLDAMQEGTDLLRQISTSARVFSRSDREQKIEFDLHKIINSALMLLKHRLKANMSRPAIEVVRQYAELPMVRCYPGQLSQVFLNILANAIDAFEEHNRDRSYDELELHPNQITIISECPPDADFVRIVIRDNAGGIEEAIHARIFDTLFTTKTVGKGTGLGLPICQQIIESQHRGQLRSLNCWHEGMQFTIELPLEGKFLG